MSKKNERELKKINEDNEYLFNLICEENNFGNFIIEDFRVRTKDGEIRMLYCEFYEELELIKQRPLRIKEWKILFPFKEDIDIDFLINESKSDDYTDENKNDKFFYHLKEIRDRLNIMDRIQNKIDSLPIVEKKKKKI